MYQGALVTYHAGEYTKTMKALEEAFGKFGMPVRIKDKSQDYQGWTTIYIAPKDKILITNQIAEMVATSLSQESGIEFVTW